MPLQSVLDGYNGTVMAYGQTGTGKTYTVGRLGKDDPSERGIMVRALEDIFANLSPGSDIMAISYLQVCEIESLLPCSFSIVHFISVEDIFYKLYRGIMQLKSILFMTHEFCYLFHYIGPYSF
ncbi:hypothetical protein BHM03_00035530 [Ensete ventricosum]|nr:hypothetical protein BHM03_00035530 [Ensete ventricosum]